MNKVWASCFVSRAKVLLFICRRSWDGHWGVMSWSVCFLLLAPSLSRPSGVYRSERGLLGQLRGEQLSFFLEGVAVPLIVVIWIHGGEKNKQTRLFLLEKHMACALKCSIQVELTSSSGSCILYPAESLLSNQKRRLTAFTVWAHLVTRKIITVTADHMLWELWISVSLTFPDPSVKHCTLSFFFFLSERLI